MAGTIVADTIQDGAGNSTAMDNAIYGSAKAWVNYNASTSTIRGSYNVSSVTKSSTGLFILNFTNALPDTNYAVIGMQNYNQDGADNVLPIITQIRRVANPFTTTQAYVATSYNNVVWDPTIACFAVFR